MSVKIRLRRTGRKKQPNYRLVVANSSTPRGGEYLDSVGTYNPLTKPADLRIDLETVDQWLARGAEMSETAASLIQKARRGGDAAVAVRGVGPDIKADKPDVTAAAEPSKAAKPARPGSRGRSDAAPAEAPAAEAPAAEAPAAEVEAPAAEAPAAEVEEPAAEAPAAEVEAPAAEAPAAEVEAPAAESEEPARPKTDAAE